jgi:hypothetical protein
MPDSKLIDNIYDQFGPTPRPCIQTASDSEALATHECDVRTALEELRQLTPHGFQEILYKLRGLRVDTDSQKLYLIKRENIGNVRSMPHVMPITDHIRSRIAIQMRNLGSLQQINLYRTFTRTPMGGAVGHAFQCFCELHFQTRILIDCVPLPGVDHIQVPHTVARCPTHIALRHTLDIYPSDVREYDDRDLQQLSPTPNVYYIPSAQNALAVDSFIFHGGYLYLFRFTVSDEHKINLNSIQCDKFPMKSQWRIILVVPDDVKPPTPYSGSLELQTLELFSSNVKMEDYLDVVRFNRQGEQEESPRKKRKRAEA